MTRDSVQPPVTLKETPVASEEMGEVADFASEAAGELPVLSSPDAELSARDDLLRLLRRFHLGGPDDAAIDLEPPGGDVLPALLAPFRDASKIRYAFPLFLYPAGVGETDMLARPLSDFLENLVGGFAPAADQARILKDNLPRIERFVRRALEGAVAPADARSLFNLAAKSLSDELDLHGDNRAKLETDLEAMLAALPHGGRLLGYGRHAAVHLFLHAARHRLTVRRRAFTFDAGQLAKAARELLRVEKGKSPEARDPEAVRSSIGEAASQYIDPAALAKTLPSSGGSEPMAADRRERVERALSTLSALAEEEAKPLVVMVHDGSLDPSWLAAEGDYELQEAVDPCLLASSVFDRKAAEYAEVFRAVRIARLELAQNYDPVLHDPWFTRFHWEAFSKPELLLLPVVVVIESADRIAGTGMSSFSGILRSGRPIQILTEVQPAGNPGTDRGENPLASYRLELGYLGIAHREALVMQSSLARPEHIMKGFLQALDATRTGLHLFSTGAFDGDGPQPLSPWLQAGAALEGRAHPFFRYNPEISHSWTECMDFSENPDPEIDWPRYALTYQDGGQGGTKSLDLAFTFADFAVLDPRLRQHFRLVPEGFARDELVSFETFLNLEPGEAFKHLPFVWAVDGKSSIRRLIVSRELALSCRDRLDYWRTLQSLAGTRNEHAEIAARLAGEKARAEAAAEREKLEAAHTEELVRAREETAGEAMQRLAEVLMGLDLSQVPESFAAGRPARPGEPTASVAAVAAPAAETEPAPSAVAEPEEEAVSFDQPWIDSMLCTSCNDCMKFNPLVFVYNDNKQAMIGDPKAGTFEQLVLAAEKCPARCIHPGKPRNPDEPNLDELIERAKPFN